MRKEEAATEAGEEYKQEGMLLGRRVFHLEDTSDHMFQWSRSAICADVDDGLFALQGHMSFPNEL